MTFAVQYICHFPCCFPLNKAYEKAMKKNWNWINNNWEER